MGNLVTDLKKSIIGLNKKVIFPEGEDTRVLKATSRLAGEKVIVPLIVGNQQRIIEKAKELHLSIDGIEIMDPETYEKMDELVACFVDRRQGKVTEEQARELLLNKNYFATMLVYMKQADGLVGGAVYSTADTVRPALQIIKTRNGIRKVSGSILLVRGPEKYIFADCAVNVSPDRDDLAEIALESARTARNFGIEPYVAMLSFSTKGSAKTAETEKVIEATELVKQGTPGFIIDGEFQFDAAFVPAIAEKKAPGNSLKGKANVFVFPNLDSGNIGYKIAQRLGQFEALGPILQGLDRPVNDLSRGCDVEDIYKISYITAVQSCQD